jgi:hypothetical protein
MKCIINGRMKMFMGQGSMFTIIPGVSNLLHIILAGFSFPNLSTLPKKSTSEDENVSISENLLSRLT